MNKINFYTYPDIPTRKFYTLLNATSSHIKEILNTIDIDCDFAIVKNNEVTNIVEWDGESNFAPDGELVAAT